MEGQKIGGGSLAFIGDDGLRVLLSLASLGLVVATVIAAGASTRLHRLFEPPSVFWLAAALAVAAVMSVLWLRARND